MLKNHSFRSLSDSLQGSGYRKRPGTGVQYRGVGFIPHQTAKLLGESAKMRAAFWLVMDLRY